MIRQREPYSWKSDSSVKAFSAGDVFTVMDAKCALCAHGAKWIARNDRKREFRIIPLQSDLGQSLMQHYGLDASDPASWLYIAEGRAYSSLDAFIHVGKRLGGIWHLLTVLSVLPPMLQDRLYRFFASNRVKFFGTADMCALPDIEVRKRLYP